METSIHKTSLPDKIRECRRAFNRYMFNSIHNPYLSGKNKKLYRHIKSLRSDQCGIGMLLENGTRYTDN